MKLARRRRLFVDFKLQGVLLAHTAIYWLYCLLSVTLTATCWVVFAHRPGSSAELFGTLWGYFGPAMVGSILLLPLVLMDCLRLSNRFAGPMVRLRVAMHRLANGESVQPVKLRDGDFWWEFAEDFNRVLARGLATEKAAETSVDATEAPAVAPPSPVLTAHRPLPAALTADSQLSV